MTRFQQVALFALRLIIGWMFLYAGLTHLLDPNFGATITGFLGKAHLLTGFYGWLTTPAMLPLTAALNAWGLTLLGLALILGVAVRLASYLGAILMLLYYLAILVFPYPDPHSYIVDDHIIYAAVLILFAALHAGRVWGLDEWLNVRFPKLSKLS